MDVQRIAAFSDSGEGGNPAGVVLLESEAPTSAMARVAANIGYSETAFAVPVADDRGTWRVPMLTSPPTRSRAFDSAEAAEFLALFGLEHEELDYRLPPAHIHGGSDHVVLVLRDRARLAEMDYLLDRGRELMRRHGLATIMLVHVTQHQMFSARNAFASGGVFEDPATGAAAAAFAGYLRDQGWPHRSRFTFRQGEDMGVPSVIDVNLSDEPGAPVKVSGQVRSISEVL